MIRFSCPHCAAKLSVPDNRKGSVGRCPRCKEAVKVPRPPEPEAAPVESEELTLIAPAERPGPAPSHLPDERELAEIEIERRRQEERLLSKIGVTRQPEYGGQRRFVWPLDIVLYPTSAPGLIVLGLIIGIPLLQETIQRAAPTLRFAGLAFVAGSVILGLYAAWYFAECVYDSAKGGTRAPNFAPVGLSEMWSRVSYLFGVYILYLFPMVIYRITIDGFEITGAKFDIIFWALAGYAPLFFPIALLAMVLNDSISSLNPFFLLGSIFRTFFQYAGLLLLFAALGTVLWLAAQGQGESDELRPLWLEAIGLVVVSYAALVVAHVLGRFYWRNRERLDWGL